MILDNLEKKQLIHPPKFLANNTHYLTIMGSQAYACNNNESDLDLYGFCIPPKEIVFPHLAGKILNFDKDLNQFDQWQQHNIEDNGRVYDFQIFNIVKYFALLMDNNPNIIDSLFTATNCVVHSTHVGNLVRENRKIFLHKGAWHRFKGYAYSQMMKIGTKAFTQNPKRVESIEKYGYDVKFAYHVVRLMDEVRQILEEGDIDLQRNNEQLKCIRRGEWPIEQIREYFTTKEKELEALYHASKLPYGPDIDKIRGLLIHCLESHYGSISNCIVEVGKEARILQEIKKLVGSI